MKSHFTIVIAASLLAVACSQNTDSGDDGVSSDNVTQFVPDSSYTDNWDAKTCKDVSPPQEGEGEGGDDDVQEMDCPSPDPAYTLHMFSGDLQQHATVLGPDASSFDINVFAGWSELGTKAEWRTQRGKKLPYGLILRHVYDDPSSGKKQHYLAVVKLDGAKMCLAGIVEASQNSANANVVARTIADHARTADGCPEKVEITTKDNAPSP